MFGRIKCPYCTSDTDKQEVIINDNDICGYIKFDNGAAYLETVYVDPDDQRHPKYALRQIKKCPMCGRRLGSYL